MLLKNSAVYYLEPYPWCYGYVVNP